MSCTVSVSSVGRGDEGRKKASNFNYTSLQVCLLSARLAVVGAEVGRGVVRTPRKAFVLQGHSHALPPYRSAYM